MVTLEEKKACITEILERYGKEFADLIAELEGIDNTTDFNTFFEKLGSLCLGRMNQSLSEEHNENSSAKGSTLPVIRIYPLSNIDFTIKL